MTDIESLMETIARRHAAIAAVGKANKAVIFTALVAEGITQVCASFDGEGDSGQIDNIAAYKGQELVTLPPLSLAVQSANWSGDDIRTIDLSFEQAVETLCYAFLELKHDGWENNDGAFGEFTFDVAAGTVALEFNGRYSDVHTSIHEF